MKFFNLTLILGIMLSFCSCNSSQKVEVVDNSTSDCNYKKIKFDFFTLDSRGRTGNENNKTAIDFEFCIPNNFDHIIEVKNIDSSLKTQTGKGRSNCGEGQLLVLGSTYNKDYKTILCKLSQLEYIKEINPTYWE